MMDGLQVRARTPLFVVNPDALELIKTYVPEAEHMRLEDAFDLAIQRDCEAAGLLLKDCLARET